MTSKRIRGVPLSEFSINTDHPLVKGAQNIKWEDIKNDPDLFKSGFVSIQPLRRMFGLLILENVRRVQGEDLLQQWLELPILQYFTGENVFHWDLPVTMKEILVFKSQLSEKGLDLVRKLVEEIKRYNQ